jgi:TnpA family transposase
VNFAILHVFGYQFAPRYRDIYDQVRTRLCGFQPPRSYPQDYVIRPANRIKPQRIIDEWDNIQRLMVSLALKTTSQHILVSKLSAYSRRHQTQLALWEYDHIIRSLYLLDYVDSVALRRNVQRALNRGEHYHKLRQAIAFANFGKLRFKTPYEQSLWQACSRLLTNCIICYNATILSELLIYHQQRGHVEQVEALRRVSPVAWQHINFHGRYTFRDAPTVVDVDDMLRQIAKYDIATLQE